MENNIKKKDKTWYQTLGTTLVVLSLAICISSFLIALSIYFFMIVGIV